MLISKAFYRHLPIFLNLFKCPLQGLICIFQDEIVLLKTIFRRQPHFTVSRFFSYFLGFFLISWSDQNNFIKIIKKLNFRTILSFHCDCFENILMIRKACFFFNRCRFIIFILWFQIGCDSGIRWLIKVFKLFFESLIK
jgi:hypothetical protein